MAIEDPMDWVQSRWDHEMLGDSTGILAISSIFRLRAIVLAGLEPVLQPLGISMTDYLLMMIVRLSEDGTRSLNRIARSMLIHPTTVTQAVDRLEKKKLVKRIPEPTDRRSTLATLTPKGVRKCQLATEALRTANFGMPGVPDNLLRDLIASIAPIRRGVGDVR